MIAPDQSSDLGDCPRLESYRFGAAHGIEIRYEQRKSGASFILIRKLMMQTCWLTLPPSMRERQPDAKHYDRSEAPVILSPKTSPPRICVASKVACVASSMKATIAQVKISPTNILTPYKSRPSRILVRLGSRPVGVIPLPTLSVQTWPSCMTAQSCGITPTSVCLYPGFSSIPPPFV